jgi:hypothetical protein
MSWYVGPILESAGLTNTSMELIPYDNWKMGCDESELRTIRDLIKPYKCVPECMHSCL